MYCGYSMITLKLTEMLNLLKCMSIDQMKLKALLMQFIVVYSFVLKYSHTMQW